MSARPTIKTDICVIGAGSGGLSVAAGAVQMGAKVVLIEAGDMGGDCLNTGCVPSKALLHAAARGDDWDKAHAHAKDAIATIAPHDSQERFEGLGCRVIRAHARFTGKRRVEAGGEIIEARRFVIATGSRPFVPDVPGIDEVPYLTNDTIFDLKERPRHLLIMGGGPIGMEMALAHRRLGCEVTVIEAAKPLGKDDPEAAALVLSELGKAGIEIVEGAEAVRLRKLDEGVEVVTAFGRVFTGSHLLVAVGRKATVEDLGLEAAGVAHTAKGVTVDARLRTTNRRIFAVGDVSGGMQFTHVAGYQGGVVIRPTVLRLRAKVRTDHIPWVTYTDPELAQVGLTEETARATYGGRVTVVRAEFAGNDRAIASGDTCGFLKVMVVAGKPVGATLVGRDAGELIAPWSLAIARGLKLSAISGMVLPYPTRSEIHKRVAGNYFSPKLFENETIKRVVRVLQRLVP
ncbi:NAD(P)/FAD-dependent oxidoreductase [Maritimibacter sp. DP1N21-5]|uniref:dihydrolipoyl dehydrogenase family protein n=1 Tax=Maritimibacter sp. DP1N21-5 TaxID=2836867 RepID=UPI001C4680E4|nr:FAD-dependent oxidoreductase [Maritimibacter sp. DP1N21-5]MBV7408165.1 FAD-dependent oxidoreductase [Maritimibacter sp. DP1N21-5]